MEGKEQVSGLWCVHMLSMDELYPAEDRWSAMEWAHALNAAMMERYVAKNGPHQFDPTVWAVPAVWPYSAEQHAESMAKHGTNRSRVAA